MHHPCEFPTNRSPASSTDLPVSADFGRQELFSQEAHLFLVRLTSWFSVMLPLLYELPLQLHLSRSMANWIGEDEPNGNVIPFLYFYWLFILINNWWIKILSTRRYWWKWLKLDLIRCLWSCSKTSSEEKEEDIRRRSSLWLRNVAVACRSVPLRHWEVIRRKVFLVFLEFREAFGP